MPRRGPVGPSGGGTGATGATGPTGPTGATGAAGTGTFFSVMVEGVDASVTPQTVVAPGVLAGDVIVAACGGLGGGGNTDIKTYYTSPVAVNGQIEQLTGNLSGGIGIAIVCFQR